MNLRPFHLRWLGGLSLLALMIAAGPDDIRHLGRVGDTLVVIDSRRAVFFDLDGRPLGDLWATRTLRDPVPRFERLLPAGRALFAQRITPDTYVESVADLVASDDTGRLLLSGNWDIEDLEPLVFIPATEPPPEIRIERGEQTMGWRSPYTFEPLYHIASNGLAIALVERDPPEAPDGDDALWRLVVIEPASADTVVDRSYTYTPEPVDHDVVVSALATGFASAFEAPVQEIETEIRSELVLPPAAPPIADVRVAESGEIWVQIWSTPGAAPVWEVLDSSGNPISRVTLPAGGEIVHIDADAVYFTERDGETLELVRYRIEREGR